MFTYNGKSLRLSDLIARYNAAYNNYLRINDAASMDAFNAFLIIKSCLIQITKIGLNEDAGWYFLSQKQRKEAADYIEKLSAFFHRNGKQIPLIAENVPLERKQIIVIPERPVFHLIKQPDPNAPALFNMLPVRAILSLVETPVTFWVGKMYDAETEREEKWLARIGKTLEQFDDDISAINDINCTNLNKDEEDAMALLRESSRLLQESKSYNEDELAALELLRQSPKP